MEIQKYKEFISGISGDTEVLMYTTHIFGLKKRAANINVGDLLMGDDGTPRKVTNILSNHTKLYLVTPYHCDSFECSMSCKISVVRETPPQYDENCKNDYKNIKCRSKKCLIEGCGQEYKIRHRKERSGYEIISTTINELLPNDKLFRTCLPHNIARKEQIVFDWIEQSYKYDDLLRFNNFNIQDIVNITNSLGEVVQQKEKSIIVWNVTKIFVNNKIITLLPIDVEEYKNDTCYYFHTEGKFLLGNYIIIG